MSAQVSASLFHSPLCAILKKSACKSVYVRVNFKFQKLDLISNYEVFVYIEGDQGKNPWMVYWVGWVS